jgi:hypothetical protein
MPTAARPRTPWRTASNCFSALEQGALRQVCAAIAPLACPRSPSRAAREYTKFSGRRACHPRTIRQASTPPPSDKTDPWLGEPIGRRHAMGPKCLLAPPCVLAASPKRSPIISRRSLPASLRQTTRGPLTVVELVNWGLHRAEDADYLCFRSLSGSAPQYGEVHGEGRC